MAQNYSVNYQPALISGYLEECTRLRRRMKTQMKTAKCSEERNVALDSNVNLEVFSYVNSRFQRKLVLWRILIVTCTSPMGIEVLLNNYFSSVLIVENDQDILQLGDNDNTVFLKTLRSPSNEVVKRIGSCIQILEQGWFLTQSCED